MLLHAKSFMYSISFIPHYHPVREVIVLPVCRWGNWIDLSKLNWSVEWPGLTPIFCWCPRPTSLSLANFLRVAYPKYNLSGIQISQVLGLVSRKAISKIKVNISYLHCMSIEGGLHRIVAKCIGSVATFIGSGWPGSEWLSTDCFLAGKWSNFSS